MNIFVKNVKGLGIPEVKNPKDAGYDFVAASDPVIVGDKVTHPLDQLVMWRRVAYIQYSTNLFIAPQPVKETDFHVEIFPRSSLSNYNLVMANSVATIDNGYRGEILIRFKYIFQPEDLLCFNEAGINRIYGTVNLDNLYKKGEKIGQIKARPNIPIKFIIVGENDLSKTERGDGGFGSTGK